MNDGHLLSQQWKTSLDGAQLGQAISPHPSIGNSLEPKFGATANRSAELAAMIPGPLTSSVPPVGEFEETPIDKDLASLPIDSKLQHHDWKVIQMGCSELEDRVRSQPQLHDDFYLATIPVLRKLLRRPQTMVQESVICALRTFLKSCPSRLVASGDELVESCAILCEKGLCGRTRAREAAEDVFITLSKLGRKEEVSRALVTASVVKNVKLSSAAIAMLAKFIGMFGIDSCNLNEIATSVPKWFGSRDVAARKGAIAVLAAIASRVGESTMKMLTSSLSAIHLKELQAVVNQQHGESVIKQKDLAAQINPPEPKAREIIKPPGKQRVLSTTKKIIPTKSRTALNSTSKQSVSRLIGQQSVPRTESKQATSKRQKIFMNDRPPESNVQNATESFDLLESLTPRDYDVLGKGTWRDKVETLENIISTAKTHPILQKDYTRLINLLEKQLSDSNVMVARVTLNLLAVMGHGLQRSFASFAKRLIPLILPKLKDANKPLQNAALTTLALFTSECVSIIEVSEDVSLALESKVPNEIQNTFMWISLSMNPQDEQIVRDINEHLGVIFNWCIRGLEMEQVACRREAGHCFSRLVALDNEKGLSLFKSLSISVAQKVKANVSKELTEYLTRKVPSFSGKFDHESTSLPSKQVLPDTIQKTSAISQHRIPLPAPVPKSFLTSANHKNSKERNVALGSSSGKAEPKAVSHAHEDPELAEGKQKINLNSVVTSSILDALRDVEWKVRQDAIVELSNTIKIRCNSVIGPELGDIPKFLLPCLTDRNRNVQKSSIELCVEIATAMGKPFEKYVAVFFPDLFSLFGDISSSVRDAAVTAANVIVALPGMPTSSVITVCVQSLMKTTNVKCKEGLLSLLFTLSSHDSWSQNTTPSEIQLLTKPLLFCLIDKSREVKRGAIKLLSRISQFFSLDYVRAIVSNDTDFTDAIRGQLSQIIEAIAQGSILIDDKAQKRKSFTGVENAPLKKIKASNEASVQSPMSGSSIGSKREQRERENSSVRWSFRASEVPTKFLSRMAGYLKERIPHDIVTLASSEKLGERFKSVKQLCGWLDSNSTSVNGFEDVLFMVAATLLGTSDQLVLSAGMSLIERILGALETSDSALDDYDLSIVLPCLLQAPMRCSPDAVRAVLSKVRLLYPGTKLFEQILSYVSQKDWLGVPSTPSASLADPGTAVGINPSLELELIGCLNEISVELGTRRASVCSDVPRAIEVLSKFLSFSSEAVRSVAGIACTWLAVFGGQQAADSLSRAGVSSELRSKFVSGTFLEEAQLPDELREAARAILASSNSKLPLTVLSKKFSDFAVYFKEFLDSFTDVKEPAERVDEQRWNKLDELKQMVSETKEYASLKLPVDLVLTLSELVFCLVEQQTGKELARKYACSLAYVLVDLLNSSPQTVRTMALPGLKKLLFFIMESISFIKLEQSTQPPPSQPDDLTAVLPLLHRTALERAGLLSSLIALVYIIKDFVDLDSPSGLAFETDTYVCHTLFQQQQLLSASDVKTSELVPLLESVHSLFVSVQYRKAVVSRKEAGDGALLERVLRFVMKTALALVRHLVNLLGPSIRTSMSFLKVPPFNSQHQTLAKFVETCLSRTGHPEHAMLAGLRQQSASSAADSAEALAKARERLNSLRFGSPPAAAPALTARANFPLDQIRERLSSLETIPPAK